MLLDVEAHRKIKRDADDAEGLKWGCPVSGGNYLLFKRVLVSIMSATLRPRLSGAGSVFEGYVLREGDSHFTLCSLLTAPRDLLSP